MSIRDYMSRDELFTWRDERSVDAERRAVRHERFDEPTDAEVKAALELREQERATR